MRYRNLAIVVLAAAGALTLFFWLSHRSDAARAQEIIAQAEAVVEQSRQENLIAIAQDAFTAAGAAIAEAKRLVAERHRGATPAAQTALRLAEAARTKAIGGIETERSAVLAAIHKEVLHRPADALEWKDAVQDMSLYDGDRIATKKGAAALIRFTEGAETRVDEDSVVVVKRFIENRQNATVNMALSVFEGSVRSVVSAEHGKKVQLSLTLPQADIIVDSGSGSDRVEVGTQIGKDESARVSVFSGTAQIKTESGEGLVVSDNQYAMISRQGAVSVPKSLPRAAQAVAPDDKGMVFVNPVRPDVTFLWEAAAGCKVARIEVSSEPIFMDKVVDLTTEHSRLTAKLLSDGNYLWRVSCIDETGAQGAYTETQRFTLVRDGDPPLLEILAPGAQAIVKALTIEARCRTEDRVMVFINGEEASAAGAGEYAHMVRLKPGLNRIVFEAIDAAGNATHARQFVTQRGS